MQGSGVGAGDALVIKFKMTTDSKTLDIITANSSPRVTEKP